MDNPNTAIIESFKQRGLETETQDLNSREVLPAPNRFFPAFYYSRELPEVRRINIGHFTDFEYFADTTDSKDFQIWLERTNIRIFRPTLYGRLWLACKKSILKPHKPWRIHGQTPSAFSNALTVSNSFRFRW